MKKLLALFMICCMCTACGTKEEAVVDVPAQPEDAVEVESEKTEAAEETEEKAETEAAGAVITPLPSTIDMNALDSCTLAVSFEEGDAYVDDTGAMQLDVTVYTYDLYLLEDYQGTTMFDYREHINSKRLLRMYLSTIERTRE